MTDATLSSLPQRLCNEIQLFDLCELTSCKWKKGLFCTDQDLLSRFEKISDEEQRAPERYLSEESDDALIDEEDDYNYDDEESDPEYDRDGDEDSWDE